MDTMTAQARRFYHHVHNGGVLKEHDVAGMVEYMECKDAEITRLRARLEQAERERAHWRLAALMSRREGFRAGIEAATEACRRMRDLHAPTQEAIYAKIRALSPADNTTTVTEAAQKVVDEYEDQTHGPVIYSIDELRDALAAQKGE